MSKSGTLSRAAQRRLAYRRGYRSKTDYEAQARATRKKFGTGSQVTAQDIKKAREEINKEQASGSAGKKQETYLAITGVENKEGKIPIEKQVSHIYRKSESGKYIKIGTMKPQPKPDSYLVVYPAVEPSERAGKTFPATFLGITKSGESVGKAHRGTISYGIPEYKIVKSPFKSQEELDKYAVKDTNKKIRIKDIPSLLYELDKKRIEMQLSILGGGTAKVIQKFGLHEPPMMTMQAFEKKYPDKSYELYIQRQKGETLIRTILAGMVETPYSIGASIYGASQFAEKTIKNPKTYPKKAIKGAIEKMKYEYEEHPQRFAGQQIGSFIGMSALGWGFQKILHYSPAGTKGELYAIERQTTRTKSVVLRSKNEFNNLIARLKAKGYKPEVTIHKDYWTVKWREKPFVDIITKTEINQALSKGKIISNTKTQKIISYRGYKYYISKTPTGLKTTKLKNIVDVARGEIKYIGKYKGMDVYIERGLKVPITFNEPKGFKITYFKGKGKPRPILEELAKMYEQQQKDMGLKPIISDKGITSLKVKTPTSPTKTWTPTPIKISPTSYPYSSYNVAGLLSLSYGVSPPKILREPEKQAHFSLVGTIKPKTESRVINIPRINYQGLLGTSAERTLRITKTRTSSLLTPAQKFATKTRQTTRSRLSLASLLGTTAIQTPKVISRTKQATLTTPRMIQMLHSGLINPKKKVVPPFQPAFFGLPHIPPTKKSKKTYKRLDLNYLLRIHPVMTEPKEISKLLKEL